MLAANFFYFLGKRNTFIFFNRRSCCSQNARDWQCSLVMCWADPDLVDLLTQLVKAPRTCFNNTDRNAKCSGKTTFGAAGVAANSANMDIRRCPAWCGHGTKFVFGSRVGQFEQRLNAISIRSQHIFAALCSARDGGCTCNTDSRCL